MNYSRVSSQLPFVAVLLLLLFAACQVPESSKSPDNRNTRSPEVASKLESKVEPLLATAPSNTWTGIGVLATNSHTLPKTSPKWASIKAQIVEENGQYFLRTTGLASNIGSQALLAQTAQNRARHEMGRLLKTKVLASSTVKQNWLSPNKKMAIAQLEIPVSKTWALTPTSD